MKILVVGSGGREHAICKKVSESKLLTKLYCASGNGGISEIAECVDIKPTDIENLVKFAKSEKIDFTIIGMDEPLVLGVVDEFQKEGLKVFGPDKKAAALEGSKVYSKSFMKKYGIPTAEYETFSDCDEALKYADSIRNPVFIKADGLALGKGAVFCENSEKAKKTIESIMRDRVFGESGDRIVIEEFLDGKEVTVLSFCDGNIIVPMESSHDYKRAKDGDTGLNTGGMGSISPSPRYTKEIEEICRLEIIQKTYESLKKEGILFKGVLYIGLILTKNGPKVIEYNARFGDPEAQSVLMRLKSDLLEIAVACEKGELNKVRIEWDKRTAMCLVAASGGYPEEYAKGFEIHGLECARSYEDTYVFHAGTLKKDEKYYTNGGRVFGLTAIGTPDEVIDKCYSIIDTISFQNMFYRKDIGK